MNKLNKNQKSITIKIQTYILINNSDSDQRYFINIWKFDLDFNVI